MPRIAFGAWEPDKPPFLSDALQQAVNVYSGPLGYRPMGSLVTSTTSLPDRCRGASSFVSPQGQASVIAGTFAGLYTLFAGGWSQIGSGYGNQGDERWRFAQFGGLAIATNNTDPLQKIDLNTGSASPLGGSPPRARLLAVVKDFLVGAVIDNEVNTLRWSGINNAEFWTIGQNQSDYQVMPTGGEITGLLGGEVGIILQRGRVVRMTYVGDNLVFQFDEVSYNVGCVTVHSVAQSGALGFFLSDNGFMMWDGSQLRPIGQERVDRYFHSLYGKADWPLMSTAVDAQNNVVNWSMGDRVFSYNYVLDRWSVTEVAAQIIFSGFTRDISIDEIDDLFGAGAGDVNLDDPALAGGDPAFYLFDSIGRLGTMSGEAMPATLETGEMEIASGRKVRMRRVRALCDAISGLSVTIAVSDVLGGEATETTYAVTAAGGDFPVRECGRYVSFRMTCEAGAVWTYAQGLDCDVTQGPRQ